MRLLLDENISPVIATRLSAEGHDVMSASVVCQSAPDEDVVAVAIAEDRVVVSEDKDFGELAFVVGLEPPGLIRVVLPRLDRFQKADRLSIVIAQEGASAIGSILVGEPGRTRLSRLP